MTAFFHDTSRFRTAEKAEAAEETVSLPGLRVLEGGFSVYFLREEPPETEWLGHWGIWVVIMRPSGNLAVRQPVSHRNEGRRRVECRPT